MDDQEAADAVMALIPRNIGSGPIWPSTFACMQDSMKAEVIMNQYLKEHGPALTAALDKFREAGLTVPGRPPADPLLSGWRKHAAALSIWIMQRAGLPC